MFLYLIIIVMKGKIIAFEGGDRAGKNTQTRLMINRLEEVGLIVETESFPTYDKTPVGVIPAEYLTGRFGDKDDIKPEVGSLFYSADRYQFKEKFEKALEKGKYLVLDRYIASNLYQVAKAPKEQWLELWEWIKKVESRLPQPDETIYLNVSPKISSKLFSGESKNHLLREGQKDEHEADENYLKRVNEAYLTIGSREGWIMIDCVEKGIMRSVEEISNQAFNELKVRKVI
ncbi:MAG: deoxynucleoside kinase [Nanoarchaeota archaeon]|nr:deoxynucleoside kinase [Nanoarchaeota archaeon]